MARIMLVDDDHDIISQNETILTARGHQVILAYSAEEAMKALETVTPDLMVLDVMMEHPKAGLHLAQKIGKEFKKIPIILMTSDLNNPNWYGEAGNTWDAIVKELSKPVKPAVLADLVDQMLK